MPTKPLDLGESGSVSLYPQAQDDAGKWKTTEDEEQAERYRAHCKVRDYSGKVRSVQKFARVQDGRTKADRRRARQAAREAAVQAVEAAVVELLASDGTETFTGRSRVREVAQAWYSEAKHSDLARSSLDAYGYALRYVTEGNSHIGNLVLDQVTPKAVQNSLQHVADTAGEGMAQTVRTVLRNAFRYAAHHSAGFSSPMADVGKVKARKRSEKARKNARETDRALTESELRRVLSLASEDDRRTRGGQHVPAGERRIGDGDVADLVHLLASVGCRLGEALAIEWTDLDLEAGTLAVGSKTVHRVKGEGLRVQDHGTTKRAERVLPLSDSLVKRLRVRERRSVYVFPSPLGDGLRDPSNTAGVFRRLFDAAGLPFASAHTLRHTVVDRLHRAGWPTNEVAKYVGHARASQSEAYMDRRQLVSADMAASLDVGTPMLKVV